MLCVLQHASVTMFPGVCLIHQKGSFLVTEIFQNNVGSNSVILQPESSALGAAGIARGGVDLALACLCVVGEGGDF